MKKVLFIIGWSLLLLSCENEMVEVEREFNWKSHEDFKYYDIVQMNSYSTSDRLFLLGNNSFSIGASSMDESDIFTHYANWYEQPNEKKLPIGADYFVSYKAKNGLLVFIPTMNPLNANTLASVNIGLMDPTYENFDLPHFSSGKCMAINDQNQALIPYVSIVDSQSFLKLALVDILAEETTEVSLDAVSTKLLTIPTDYRGVDAIESIDDNFFLMTNAKVYRIDHLGNVATVLEARLTRIIESSGTLYGFDIDNMFFSTDDGITWNMGYSVPYIFSSLHFMKIDNKIIGYRLDQMWEIEVSEAGLNVRELDNEGLSGISITSISRFDGKVYLSSLSGVFYKSEDEFFDDRIR